MPNIEKYLKEGLQLMEFEKLATVKFQQKMKPAALRIYAKLFPGCVVQDLRENGVRVHILDKEFGIDSLIVLEDGQWLSIQEKYRNNDAIRYLDFTQEYKNAVGTPQESNGEWYRSEERRVGKEGRSRWS